MIECTNLDKGARLLGSHKKGKRRTLAFSAVITLLSPIFLSSAVSAAELNNSDVASQVEEGAFLQGGSSQEMDSSTLVEEEINANDTMEEESEKEQLPKEDAISEKIPDQDVYSAEDTREKAIEVMDNENQVSTYSMKARTVSKTDAFINSISGYAVSVAETNKLYASVMIAQAILESAWGTSILAYAPNYNLFGIKAGAGDSYFAKYSKEYSKEKGWTVEKSNFKKYPSYKESLIDYANKLRKGPDWDRKNGSWSPKYYAGTWKENAPTYKDATEALSPDEDGKNGYATDPKYGENLNRIIAQYKLTRFDQKTSGGKDSTGDNLQNNLESNYSDEVISTSSVNYRAYITGETDGIYSAPKNTKSSKVNYDALEYFNKNVTVTQEKKTKNGATWALITLGGKQLGWIDKKGLSVYEIILSEKPIKYSAKIIRGTDSINTRPYGTEGAKRVATSSAYLNKKVNIIKEAVTNRATWALVTIGNKELGWIDKRALDIETITSTKNVSYTATITRGADNITSKPFGTEGYEINGKSSLYLNKDVKVVKEAVTRRATWALITINGKELGWIDKKALTQFEEITSTKDINYVAKIIRGTDNITTEPYGTKGYKRVAKSSEYLNSQVNITKEAVTDRATWALISKGGKELGWIDKAALDIEKVTSEKTVNYTRFINRGSDNITTNPYGTEGYKTLNKASKYLGEKVQVVKEATTRRATWALISIDGKELGWIDKAALTTQEVILSEKNINYSATIKRGTDTINTKPYGTKGYKTIARSSKYLNKQVKVTKEAVTDRATWALISVGGKELGWIDKAALDIEKILSEKAVNYTSYINRKTDNITTKPYGTEGYTVVTKSSNHFGKKVKVTKEANTRRSEWAYISIDGKNIGWIDKSALTMDEVIISQKNIQYSAVIKRGTDNITTTPYGTKGYMRITKSSSYLNKSVKITKEAVTDRATWAYISINGKNVGWIDKSALDIEKVTSETNVKAYTARVIRNGDSISSKPWGVEGYTVKHSGSNYFGAEVTVKKEAKTRRATWALIAFNGKELGWIDKAALKKIDPNKKVIVIDAGHGGKDSGATAGGVYEKTLNLSVAKKVQSKLKSAGYEVIMIRSTDVFVELPDRAMIANRSNADIFVSIHTNSFNGITSGIETFSYNQQGSAKNPIVANDRNRTLKSNILSSSIQNSLISTTNARTRGAKKANFHVIRETGMPAVLTEIGFIDNTTERNKLVTNSYQEKLANGITSGIKEYFRLVK